MSYDGYDDDYVIENKNGIKLSREATMLEVMGSLYLEQLFIKPNKTEHMDEITLIAYWARKGNYDEAEKVIQKLLGGK